MKSIRYSKTWNDFGWIYRMSRVKNGRCYQISIAITHTELHYRDVIAWRLRRARVSLLHAVATEAEYLPDVT